MVGRWDHSIANMRYRDGERTALVEINRGDDGTRVYADSLAWGLPDGSSIPLTEEELAVVWPRILAGMTALDMNPELFDG